MKNQVQALKNAGYVNFGYDKAGGPNVISNLLPNHSEPKINGVFESSTEGRKTYIKDVITPMKVIHKELVYARFFQSRKGKAIKEKRLNEGYCQYHAEVQRHMVQKCTEFRDIVHDSMDMKEIEFSKLNDPSIDVIIGTT